jgi:ATP-dependent DNA ligase
VCRWPASGSKSAARLGGKGGGAASRARTTISVARPSTSAAPRRQVLSDMRWVQCELVAEVKYLTWTDLLRQSFLRGFEDKRAAQVRCLRRQCGW